MRDDVSTFESHRPALVALAYRMLGDVGRAEDVVQDAWLRWQGRAVSVDAPRPFLLKIVTRLCLNELDSARARHEETRGDRLPEPVALDGMGFDPLALLDEISMAFLVLLQRLTPSERAVLLLHEVFGVEHAEIAALLQKTEAASRQLLSRARDHVAAERRVFKTSSEEHRRLLAAFVRASQSGDVEEMMHLLADDAVLIVDTGPEGRQVGRIRNAGRPIAGARRVASFIAAVTRERGDGGEQRSLSECVLNGQPATVFLRDGRPDAALLISVADGRIHRVFVHADPRRLTHLGVLRPEP